MTDLSSSVEPPKAGHIGKQLWQALRARVPVAPLTESHPDLTIDQAYEISLAMLAAREAEGERDKDRHDCHPVCQYFARCAYSGHLSEPSLC